MTSRQSDFLLLKHFGQKKMPYTANFADIYAFITVVLYDGELHRCLSRSRVNLFENGLSNHLNTSQVFLLMDVMLETEILCLQFASSEKYMLGALRIQGLPNWNLYVKVLLLRERDNRCLLPRNTSMNSPSYPSSEDKNEKYNW